MGSHPVLRRHLFPPSLCSLPPASLCPGSYSPSSRPLVSVLPAFFPSFFRCSPFSTCRIYSVLGIAFICIHPSIHQPSISPSLHHHHGNLHPSLPVNQPINRSIPSTCLRIGQITRHCLQYTLLYLLPTPYGAVSQNRGTPTHSTPTAYLHGSQQLAAHPPLSLAASNQARIQATHRGHFFPLCCGPLHLCPDLPEKYDR